MYHHLLDSFITVVQCKSFNKAAEKLYISSTAIMKQMNNLESELGMKLFVRHKSGIELTPSGEIIYKRAIELIQLSKRYIEEARQMQPYVQYTIRIGSSFLNPSNLFINLWRPIAYKYPEFSFEIVPYEDNSLDHNIISKLLENKIDMLYCTYSSSSIPKTRYHYVKDTPFEIALSNRHPLSNYNVLTLDDLKNYVLRIGNSNRRKNVITNVREYIKDNYPEIIIRDVESIYTLSTFNQTDIHNEILLTLPQWNNIHPNLFNKSINLPFHNQFAVFTSDEPSIGMQKLIEVLRKEHIISN